MFRRSKNTKQKFSLGAASILVGSIFLVSPLAEANGTSSYGDRLTAVLADPTLTAEEKSKLWDKIMQERRVIM
ncbi:MAG: YSIRK-type signal peptide-containing protein [Gemella sp.]|nr:YSIRK-type signal peptide-containing protein [Gemella sp.]